MEDVTRKFTALDSKAEMREILSSVYNSLMVKGYNPINQIVGYILSEDPTYITNYNNARTLICRIDRDELLQELLRTYLEDAAGDDGDAVGVFAQIVQRALQAADQRQRGPVAVDRRAEHDQIVALRRPCRCGRF